MTLLNYIQKSCEKKNKKNILSNLIIPFFFNKIVPLKLIIIKEFVELIVH